jgi:hypothetical protein
MATGSTVLIEQAAEEHDGDDDDVPLDEVRLDMPLLTLCPCRCRRFVRIATDGGSLVSFEVGLDVGFDVGLVLPSDSKSE